MEIRQSLAKLHAHEAFASSRQIIQTLADKGHTTVFAGGCVRDALLGVSPKDLDLATSAPPEVVEQAFSQTLAVGKAFGTIVVVIEGHSFEVTTFRKEGPYLDGRHPSEVHFTNMREDAQRRDFTINALFYDPRSCVILDFVGGVEDLKSQRLRAVGEASQRLTEDRLRLLRAVRFVAQLGFKAEPSLRQAIARQGEGIKSVSVERILNEVKRLLQSPYLGQALSLLNETHLSEYFWPELSVFPKSLPQFQNWESAFVALMLLSKQPSEMEARLRQWKASRESVRIAQEELRAVEVLLEPSSTRAQRVRALGSEFYADILLLGELRAGSPQVQRWIGEYLAVATAEGGLPAPFLTGQDLLARGFKPGVQLGQTLQALYDLQLTGEITSKMEALKLADQL